MDSCVTHNDPREGGGLGRTSGSLSGLLPEGDYPGYRDTPGRPRWGHTPDSATPGAARGEGTSGFFSEKTEPKQEKNH